MENLYQRLAPFLLMLIEDLLLIASGTLILCTSRNAAGRNRPAAFRALQRAFVQLARRKGLCVLLIGLSVITIRVALIPILGIPQPGGHDEFSYLLAADTFAHGKLTNPTHPLWIHFESFHIVEKPTYMSMYPPAQGLVLAAGQIVGHPWAGQVLVTALMCSALCWMLQGWLPPPWALLGASLAVLRLGILSYWMNGYWSASIAALGGALVLGAWPRLRLHLRVVDALLMALGLAILANSRPYEGLVFAVPVIITMLLWLFGRSRPAFSQSVPGIIMPIVCFLLIASAASGYYYYRVTGNPLRLTYQVNADTYAAAPYFLWQTSRPEVAYHHGIMRDFYRWELREFETNRTFIRYLQHFPEKFIPLWQFYLGPLLTLHLLALPRVARQRKMRLPLLICGAVAAGIGVETWTLPHYFAPATGALYLLLVQGMRHLWHWFPRQRPIGPALVRAIPVLVCTMILIRLGTIVMHAPIEPMWPRGNLERAALSRKLQQLSGPQLVVVTYGAGHDLNREWVYNDADIDRAKVVWARDMGNNTNQELLNYFGDREAWLVNADDSPSQLKSYGTPAR
jgi:hypothetical protein